MVREKSKLTAVFKKAEYAKTMATQANDSIHHDAGLWYHAIAMFNAYYAITEELLNHTKNGNDAELTAAVDDWWKENSEKSNAFFLRERNLATHQGKIDVVKDFHWELDVMNDTEHPIRSARVSIDGSKISGMRADEFLDLCRRAIEFLYNGIIEIDNAYKAKGGIKHAIPEPEKIPESLYKNYF